MRQLRTELEKHIMISDEEWAYIEGKFKAKSAKKGEIIHQAGDIFSEVWYIKSALARSYFIDNNGKDFTWQLYFNDESMSKINLLDSFLSRHRSTDFV